MLFRSICGFVDDRNEKTGRKIRDAELKKVPFMLIVGEQEESGSTVSVRKHGKGDLGVMSVEQFANLVEKEIEDN